MGNGIKPWYSSGKGRKLVLGGHDWPLGHISSLYSMASTCTYTVPQYWFDNGNFAKYQDIFVSSSKPRILMKGMLQ